MQNRRNFLRTIPLIPGTMFFSLFFEKQSFGAQHFEKDVGLQLWTLRNELKQSVEATLDAIAAVGYKTLEPYGFDGRFFSIESDRFCKMCADRGMTVYSTHAGITTENAEQLAAIAAKNGLRYIVLPSFLNWPDKTADDFKKAAVRLNQIGEICQRYGLKFSYHNHGFEFIKDNGKLLYEILLNDTDPDLVSFQIDLYWIVKAGHDPFRFFDLYPGRFTTWHIKDITADGKTGIVGNGRIDFKLIMTKAAQAGLEKLFVEQEQYDEGTPIFCAQQSLKYIQKHLL